MATVLLPKWGTYSRAQMFEVHSALSTLCLHRVQHVWTQEGMQTRPVSEVGARHTEDQIGAGRHESKSY